jgi:hypothetical protein
MRRLPLLVVAALVLVLLWGALPTFAQSIYGLSFRPTDAAPASSPRGSVDIEAGEGDNYLVTVDLASAAPSLKLANYDGANSFVVWSVDMDGQRHNLGSLNDDLTAEKLKADHLIAKLFLTAEADAEVAQPAGDRLYEVTLRNVAEVESTSSSTLSKAAVAEASATVEEKPTATTVAAGAAKAETKASPTAETKPAEAKPQVLPTTGDSTRDLLVLLAVVVGLVLIGTRLRTLRV